MLVDRTGIPLGQALAGQDLDEGAESRPVAEVIGQVDDGSAVAAALRLLQVFVHPVAEGVGLDVHPEVLVALDGHALGGGALGRPGHQPDKLRRLQLLFTLALLLHFASSPYKTGDTDGGTNDSGRRSPPPLPRAFPGGRLSPTPAHGPRIGPPNGSQIGPRIGTAALRRDASSATRLRAPTTAWRGSDGSSDISGTSSLPRESGLAALVGPVVVQRLLCRAAAHWRRPYAPAPFPLPAPTALLGI
jgi:hypothetical protein